MATKKLPKRGHFHSSLTVFMKDGDVKISTNLHYDEEKVRDYNFGGGWEVKREDVKLIQRWNRGKEDEFIP